MTGACRIDRFARLMRVDVAERLDHGLLPSIERLPIAVKQRAVAGELHQREQREDGIE
jgi:hypothetical protein